MTRAWLRSSRVRERRVTSGRFTAPSVTPELMYLTKAFATKRIVRNVQIFKCEVLLTFYANCTLCLLSAATDMGCQNNVLQAAKLLSPMIQAVREVVAISGWLTRVYIQGSTANLP